MSGPVINVAGPVLIRTSTGTSLALEDLGYSINGVQIFPDVFTLDVPSDLNGGDDGPPIDIQHLGQVHRIRLELSKFDMAVYKKIEARTNGETPGSITRTVGSLYAANSYGYRVLFTADNFVRNYIFGVARAPIQSNHGSKFSRPIIEFECHTLEGVLWNVSTT